MDTNFIRLTYPCLFVSIRGFIDHNMIDCFHGMQISVTIKNREGPKKVSGPIPRSFPTQLSSSLLFIVAGFRIRMIRTEHFGHLLCDPVAQLARHDASMVFSFKQLHNRVTLQLFQSLLQ